MSEAAPPTLFGATGVPLSASQPISDATPWCQRAAWSGAVPAGLHRMENGAGSWSIARVRLRGIPAWVTPPWSLDVGYIGGPWTATDWAEAQQALLDANIPLAAWDFPVGWDPGKISDFGLKRVHLAHRHTRWAFCDAPLPANRRKQVARAQRAGLHWVRRTDSEAVEVMLRLHQGARHRKGIASDERGLRSLMRGLIADDQAHFLFVINPQGHEVAGGVFLERHLPTSHRAEWIYALGGAVRGPQSGLATVLLVAKAMEQARETGFERFDFGGSQDAGVDAFYAEFGGVKQAKLRAMLWNPGWGLPFHWLRPDLFR